MPKDYFRAFERRSTNLPAQICPVGEELSSARVLNLSLGGAKVAPTRRLRLGVRVRLELEVPNLWAPLRLPAKVVWARDVDGAQHVGVAFQFDDARIAVWLLDVLGSNAYG
jgi:Tfp pilus assembly protein PilZ